MAMTLDDLLWRRMRVGLTAGQGVDIAPKIARFLAERGHWNEARITAEVAAYTQRILWLNAEFKEGGS
jgi:glycerol-3-phosphate dehydrogenase